MSAVDVHIITYNHVKFISKCLDSVLSQKTSFKVNIIVGDDNSSDGTQEVLKGYKKNHPDKITLLLHSNSLGPSYSPGSNNFKAVLANCQSTYIALLDGDDFWTDDSKLQTQFDFLENNPDFAGCFHNSTIVNEEGEITNVSYFKSNEDIFNQEACVKDLKSSFATSSLFFRKEAIKNLPRWYTRLTSDYAFDIVLTRKSKLKYLNNNHSSYRHHSGGIWMGQSYHENMKQMLYRYLVLYKSKELRDKYGEFLKDEIKILNKEIVGNYRKHKAVRSLIKYFFNYFRFRYF